MEIIRLVCVGLVLGMVTVIPGLSVGTMAVVFNVYDRLIGVITPNVRKIFAAWKFWLPLVIGGVGGLFFFSKLITVLYENYLFPTMWFFIGIIAGSLPLVYSRVCPAPSSVEQSSAEQGYVKRSCLPSISSLICAVSGLTVMIVMAVLRPNEAITVYTELTTQLTGLLILAGVLAAIAMIVPGLSGAFMLLIIGLYRTILQAVSELNIPLLIPVVLGAAAGLLLGAAFVRFMLAKAPRETYGAVLGLVAGSVIVLYPGSFGSGIMIIISIVSLLAGASISFFFSRKKL
jgi:putative membrane protein